MSKRTFAVILVFLMTGCQGPTTPNAPPLDIRGQYDVAWNVGYNRPDAPTAGFDPSLPKGDCSGTVVIERQTGGSFRGTITIGDGAEPPCHSATFEVAGSTQRVYAGGENGYDYGWDLVVLSDVEPLLGCRFSAQNPRTTPGPWRGSGRVSPTGQLWLAWSNIYDCVTGRWWIVAGAYAHRRGT